MLIEKISAIFYIYNLQDLANRCHAVDLGIVFVGLAIEEVRKRSLTTDIFRSIEAEDSDRTSEEIAGTRNWTLIPELSTSQSHVTEHPVAERTDQQNCFSVITMALY